MLPLQSPKPSPLKPKITHQRVRDVGCGDLNFFKTNIFLWKILNELTVRVELQRRHLLVDTPCSLCNAIDETVHHLHVL